MCALSAALFRWGPSDVLFALAYYYEHTQQQRIIDHILHFYRSLYTFMFQPTSTGGVTMAGSILAP